MKNRADSFDPYARIAEYYDLEHAAFRDDIELYLSLAQATGDPILELGCGSGRILLPLADAGFRVTGSDQSPAMLDRAHQAVGMSDIADRVHLIEAPMTEADRMPGGPFGLVIIGLNGLLHLPTQAEQRAVLAAVRRALDPRGQLVIDILNPTLDALQAFDRRVVHEGSWTATDGTQIDKFSTHELHAAEQLIESRIWYDQCLPDSTIRRTATQLMYRYLHRAELELLLELTGFVEWQVYGSYDLDPLTDAAERLIVTAEVTPSPE